jgi:hypothetical protein
MTAPTDPLQIAAALCEDVYRRGNLDQQITFADIGVAAQNISVLGLSTDITGPQTAGYYYDNATGFVGSLTTAGNTAYVTFRGTDNSGGVWDVVDDLVPTPLEWLGFSAPGSGGHSDPLDFTAANGPLGSGTIARTQLDDALALARAAILQNPGKQIAGAVSKLISATIGDCAAMPGAAV